MSRGGSRSAPHSALIAETRKRLGREPGLVLYLNTKGRLKNIGGQHVYVAEPALGVGTSDLVGMLAPQGRWFCLEAKTGEAVETDEQKLFGALVRKQGGFYSVFRTVDDAVACLERAREGKTE